MVEFTTVANALITDQEDLNKRWRALQEEIERHIPKPEPLACGASIVVDIGVPVGEVHFRDHKGRLVGKIVNVCK